MIGSSGAHSRAPFAPYDEVSNYHGEKRDFERLES